MSSNYCYKSRVNSSKESSSNVISHIKNLLDQQTNPRNNLGTYTTTLMDKDASDLFELLLPYNKVNQNEYPKIKQMEGECISFMLEMLHAPAALTPLGLSTNGSSEAIFLACLALKNNNRLIRKPNLIISKSSHSSWLNAARILEINIKEVSYESSSLEEELLTAIDECTIGVGVTIGTTSTGFFESVENINKFLKKYKEASKKYIPIHVDAASGGFIAPFKYPELTWDFRLEHVASINISGHKYGMVYPSIGWAFWKDTSLVPKDIRMPIDYLKNNFTHFGVNFSTPASYIIAQYYNIKKYGFLGYKEKVEELFNIKESIENELKKIPSVNVISDNGEYRLPVVCWTYDEECLYEIISQRFEELGWIVPYCDILRGEDTKCFRIVVRHNFVMSDLFKLKEDLKLIHCL
ncbi:MULTISPECIES: aminotransferase class V-fold PLP-dependent enzyme [Serratia]|nr:aminotransferase class V-fold PLP-dependent enzyme [Serratia marcescens]HED2348533.1 aminotransferase class V-fold PLP-dependent enzyme [Serratia marcescens]